METKSHKKLNDIEPYKLAFSLSNYVWLKVNKWDHFQKTTVGSQFVRAVDSISANIAEGFGRHGKKDKINFYRYARGSVFECLDWDEKCKVRELLVKEDYDHIFYILQQLPRQINGLIKLTNDNLKV